MSELVELTVNQFISHLHPEAQGAILVSQESMLEYLRERWVALDDASVQIRRELHSAALARLEGKRVRITADPDERFAAKAVFVAVMRLAKRLESRADGKHAVNAWHRANTGAASQINDAVAARARTASERRPSKPTEMKPDEGSSGIRRWKAGYNGGWGWVTPQDFYPRASFTITVMVGTEEIARLICRADQLDKLVQDMNAGTGRSRQHLAAITAHINKGYKPVVRASHPSANGAAQTLMMAAYRLAKRFPKLTAPVCLDREWEGAGNIAPKLPEVEVIPETLEAGPTLHFDASSRDTGYARVVIDGEVVDRVRTWRCDEPRLEPDPEKDRIRGGKVTRVAKPSGSRRLAWGERRVIELETICTASSADRLERETHASPVLAAMLSATATLERGCAMPMLFLRMLFMAFARLETLRELAPSSLHWLHGRERLLGIGTRKGEVWVRGDADEEVLAKIAGRLALTA
jgi:hypothetical protein